MIHIENLVFSFPQSDFRINMPTLQIGSGERAAVVGPSGCGKTTFLHLIAGIHVPAQGEIRVLDRDIHTLQDAARRSFRVSKIGLVFQDFELIDYLNVFENILLPYRLNSKTLPLTAAVLQRAEALAEHTGVAHRLRYLPHRLSQGEKQRVAICRALLPQPSLILADEPTGNLDPASRNTIMDLLFAQVAQTEATLVMVTHDHALARRFARTIDFREWQA